MEDYLESLITVSFFNQFISIFLWIYERFYFCSKYLALTIFFQMLNLVSMVESKLEIDSLDFSLLIKWSVSNNRSHISEMVRY